MFRVSVLLSAAAGLCCAEVHSFTLRQALEIASRQNPEVAIARLDQQRAQQGIDVARDPFRPKVYLGSGAAYTYGYPNSIDGNAPSLAQVRTDMYLYNRPKSYNLAAAKELERGSQFGAQAKGEEVAYNAAVLFLNASQAEHLSKTISGQLPSLESVVRVMQASVNEGSALPLDVKRAQLNLAMSQQQLDSAQANADYYEMMLAITLGYAAADRVKPIDSDLTNLSSPPDEEQASEQLLRENRELKEMQSNVIIKELDIKSYKSSRLPQIGLVAQYAYFAKYNYEQYFQKFQHNNFQLGASIVFPLFVGSAAEALAAQSYTDLQKIRIQMNMLRNRLLAETHRNYELWKTAQNMRNLARMQLDVAREELSVKLAENSEGRITVNQLETARLEESNRWQAFYDSDMQELRARMAILKQTGNLLAAVRALGAAPTIQ